MQVTKTFEVHFVKPEPKPGIDIHCVQCGKCVCPDCMRIVLSHAHLYAPSDAMCSECRCRFYEGGAE